jgi:hypothetical protein
MHVSFLFGMVKVVFSQSSTRNDVKSYYYHKRKSPSKGIIESPQIQEVSILLIDIGGIYFIQ